MTFTDEQQATIDARGSSVLVSAAAGSGKTAVLVERIIKMVSDREHPIDIDRLLVVTFTQAAAAQMRERITRALSQAVEEHPGDEHLVRQLTLIHNAQITTIDSFCLYLIRNYFDEIGLDPDFRVADEGEIRMLRQEVLGKMLEEYHERKSESFLRCVEYFAPAGNEKRLEEQILTLYDFAMSYPWPRRWLTMHREDYAVSADGLDGTEWAAVLKNYVRTMTGEAIRMLEEAEAIAMEPDGPYMYADTLAADREQAERLLLAESLQDLYAAFGDLNFGRISSKKDPSVSLEKRERAKELRDEVKELLKEIGKKYFYASPAAQAERMVACAPVVSQLLDLVLDFCDRMDAAKRDKNVLDFGDMEHMALQILVREDEADMAGAAGGAVSEATASAVALELRSHFAEIMIDEYQDSNLVQEYLLQSISGEDDERYNRFMVGDVKQSIYKFRLARPELFMEKFDCYEQQAGAKERRIDLRKNFRSRQQVTDSVNDVFCRIMGKDLGGVAYDENAALYPGAVYPEPSGINADGGAGGELASFNTELLLTVTGNDGLDDKEREAQAVAARIRELVGKFQVTDSETRELRPVRYGDIVILLRTTSGWDEVFKKALEENGIPVYVTSRTGYFAATEVQTVLNFLKILNNPLQDIPLFGVLKSPVGGFSDEEIARIRAQKSERKGKGKLYYSLKEYAAERPESPLGEKAGKFLDWLTGFRKLVAYLPIRKLIERFLQETGYLYLVSALPGGEQRRANIEMLLTKAENFEKTSYTGLFHFIRYMEQAEKYEIDYGEASLQDENADTVRIMSIHKSKGLEFPVCFVSGLSKRFNMQDAAKPVIVDMDYGVAVDYVDTEYRVRQGTLKKNVLAGKLQQDSLGEELRVLYVAMTRAQEKLILTGNCREKLAEQIRQEAGEMDRRTEQLLPFSIRSSASCYLDWVLPAWLDSGRSVQLLEASDLVQEKVQELQGRERLRLRLKQMAEGESRTATGQSDEQSAGPESENSTAEISLENLRERMQSVYPHAGMQKLYTKTTVSELKIAGMEETAEEAYHMFEEADPVPYLPAFLRKEETDGDGVGGAARGSAYHKALELFDFETRTGADGKVMDADQVRDFLDAEQQAGRLSAEYREAVSPGRIQRFLDGSLAQRMEKAARNGKLYKEQPFVLGLSASELSGEFPEEETVLIQGIIDVWFEEEDGLVVADYKTDAVKEAQELLDRYQLQLDYYGRALEQLTGRKVKEKIIYSFALQREIGCIL